MATTMDSSPWAAGYPGKRVFDLCISGLVLPLLAPLFIIISVLVKVSSRGPVFFRQERIGLCGRPFTMLKFRSMVVDAPRLGSNVSPVGDPRVTRLGGFLRKTYLDEMPQLLNVLRGDMSLVGPRPETPEYVAMYSPQERRVLDVRPGMAGPSTLAFESEAAVLARSADPYRYYVDHLMHERVRVDLEYLERQSILYDLGVLLRTLLMVVSE
jgi:lipopolysaccharide/colanic/teichoic acid biosynthesis glycosyltransferase